MTNRDGKRSLKCPGRPVFSIILAAMALLASAAVLVIMAGMDRGSPGEVAYASDPGSDRVAAEVEAREARRAALTSRVESGELTVVQAGGLGLTAKGHRPSGAPELLPHRELQLRRLRRGARRSGRAAGVIALAAGT